MTIAQQLKVTEFPFFIKDKNDNTIYCEESNGYWYKSEYDANGNIIYWENSSGYWSKRERDSHGKEIYFEDSNGFWSKSEWDDNGNQIYRENSNGCIVKNPMVTLKTFDQSNLFKYPWKRLLQKWVSM